MPLTSCQTSMTLAAGAESSKVDYMPLHHAAIAMNIAPIPFPLYWLLLINALALISVIRHYIYFIASD